MKKNGQLKAIVTYGMRDWEMALPRTSDPAGQSAYAPLGKRSCAEKPDVLLRLNEQGLSEAMEKPLEMKAIVQGVIDAAAARSRSGRVSPGAEITARWEIPLPAEVPAQDALRFCELAYQYVVRSAPIEHELCGVAGKGALEIWFIPLSRDGRGQLQLSTRNLMTRSEYLDLYEELKAYLSDELGYEVDVDADDVMFKESGYTEAERREAIAGRDEARRAAQETGDALMQDAKNHAQEFAKSFRHAFRS